MNLLYFLLLSLLLFQLYFCIYNQEIKENLLIESGGQNFFFNNFRLPTQEVQHRNLLFMVENETGLKT